MVVSSHEHNFDLKRKLYLSSMHFSSYHAVCFLVLYLLIMTHNQPYNILPLQGILFLDIHTTAYYVINSQQEQFVVGCR